MTNKQGKSFTFSGKSTAVLILIVVATVVGFWAGSAYQSNHNKSASTTGGASAFGGARGGGFQRGGGGIGTVSTVSASSITVSSTSGSSKTYSITSATTISDNGQTVTTSDIQNGEKVIVIPSTSNATQAARILVNPSFGGGPSAGASGSSTSTSGSTTGSVTN
ncbi:MAG TPA: hypothetical protein VIH90_08080 [Candidatus Saccharimonadales bacterium]